MSIDIFSERIKEAISKGYLADERLVCDISGKVGNLGPFSAKLLARLSPKMREKIFNINNEKLKDFLVASESRGDPLILEENVQYFIERGWISSSPSKEKLRENIRKLGNQLMIHNN